MKFFSQILATVALLAGAATALEKGVQLGEALGGPHGTKYSDVDLVAPGQTVQAITIRSGERVNGVGLDVTDPSGSPTSFYHGGRKGSPNTLTLGEDEYITSVEAHWGEKGGDHTRIKYIQFTTSEGNTISGGNPTNDKGKESAHEGYQLGGFMVLAARSSTRSA